MTGGQFSPTTPFGLRTSSSPYGNLESAFDICGLAREAGAAFVARSTVYHARLLEQIIGLALNKEGFSVVEVISNCTTYFGREMGLESPVEMMKWQRDNAVLVEKAKSLRKEELKQKLVIGVLVDRKAPAYHELYNKLMAKCRLEDDEI
jgi:2-oxoglutarate ferredoxin oxidoreductase subunit beta